MLLRRSIPAAVLLLAMLLPAAVLPRKAPDFTVNLLQGKSLRLSQYQGRPVVMIFVLTYCTHCQATIAALSKLQKEYAPRGLQVVASAIDPNAEAALPLFLHNFNPPFPVGFNTNAAAGQLVQPTGKLPQMPLMAFIDRDGNIVAQHEGEEPFFNDKDREGNLRSEIEKLLKPPAARKK